MTQVELTPLVPVDIEYVIENIWARGRKEAEQYGIISKEAMITYLVSRPREFAWTICVDEEPVVVLGADKEPDGSHYTWFVATERFTEFGAEITRLLLGLLKKELLARPDIDLKIRSLSDHPKADGWFKRLGFTQLPQEGVFKAYRYDRNKLMA